ESIDFSKFVRPSRRAKRRQAPVAGGLLPPQTPGCPPRLAAPGRHGPTLKFHRGHFGPKSMREPRQDRSKTKTGLPRRPFGITRLGGAPREIMRSRPFTPAAS